MFGVLGGFVVFCFWLLGLVFVLLWFCLVDVGWLVFGFCCCLSVWSFGVLVMWFWLFIGVFLWGFVFVFYVFCFFFSVCFFVEVFGLMVLVVLVWWLGILFGWFG